MAHTYEVIEWISFNRDIHVKFCDDLDSAKTQAMIASMANEFGVTILELDEDDNIVFGWMFRNGVQTSPDNMIVKNIQLIDSEED